MKSFMNTLGLVMNSKDLGVAEEMLQGIAKGSFILEGGYKVLTHDEIVHILKNSMQIQKIIPFSANIMYN
jgi:hypothetical protein